MNKYSTILTDPGDEVQHIVNERKPYYKSPLTGYMQEVEILAEGRRYYTVKPVGSRSKYGTKVIKRYIQIL